MMGRVSGVDVASDKMSLTVSLADGSVGTLHYFANGHKSYPKETMEVFCDGKILRLDNFRKLKGFGWNNFNKMNLWGQDKGHKAQFCKLIQAVAEGAEPLIPFEQIENVTKASFAAMQSAQQNKVIQL
jgi:predicted dehydrogenase